MPIKSANEKNGSIGGKSSFLYQATNSNGVLIQPVAIEVNEGLVLLAEEAATLSSASELACDERLAWDAAMHNRVKTLIYT